MVLVVDLVLVLVLISPSARPRLRVLPCSLSLEMHQDVNLPVIFQTCARCLPLLLDIHCLEINGSYTSTAFDES